MSPSASVSLVAPTLTFHSGRQEYFVGDGPGCMRRMTPEDMARAHTGYDRESHEPHLGIYVVPVGNGLTRFGFDVFKLNLQLREATIERLQRRWREEAAATLPKTLLRRVLRRTHLARSFVKFEVQPAAVEQWKGELESILSDPESYEQL
jgi:hypothetical protein